MFCPQCGAENGDQARFCPRCGAGLQGAAPPATVDAAARIDAADLAAPPLVAEERGAAPAAPAYGYGAPAAPGYGASAPAAPAYGYGTPPDPPPTDYGPAAAYPDDPALPDSAGAARVGVAAAGPGPAPATAPRRRSLLGRVLLVVALLVLVGAGVGGYLLYQVLNKPNIPAARLIPADAYGYVSLVPQPQGGQKAALDKLQAAFKSQPGFQAAWDRFFTQAQSSGAVARSPFADCGGSTTPQPAGTPASFSDIASYLGNSVSFALLPLTKGEITALGSGADAGKIAMTKLLFLVDLDFNPLNKKGLLPKLKGLSDKPADMPLVETYREIEIRRLPDNGCPGGQDATTPQTIDLALIGGTAAVALDPAPLHAAIDHYKDGQSLADSAAFQALDKELPAERLGTLYLNLTGINDTLQTLVPAMTAQSSGASGASGLDQPVKPPTVSGALDIAFSAHDDGFQIDSASDTQVAGQVLGSTAVPAADALNDVPAGSWAFLSGVDLKTTIGQGLALYRKQDPSGQMDKGLAQIKDQTGVDFEHDVLPLLGGDYLLSLQGGRAQNQPIFTGVAALRMKSGDGPKMRKVIDSFNAYQITQGSAVAPVAVGSAQLFGTGPTSPFLYGVAGDKLYLLGVSDTLQGAVPFATQVLAQQGQGLGTDAAVRSRLAHLPPGSNTTLYLDLTKIRTEGVEPSLQDQGLADYQTQIAPFARPFQYLLTGGVTTAHDTTSHVRSVLFVGIGP